MVTVRSRETDAAKVAAGKPTVQAPKITTTIPVAKAAVIGATAGAKAGIAAATKVVAAAPVVAPVVKTIPPPPAVDPLVQAALDKAKGTELWIEYRTPSGETKAYMSSDLGTSNIPGEFLSAHRVTPSGGIGEVYTFRNANQQVIFDVREQVLATPSAKEQYERTGVIPTSVREQVNLTEDVVQKLRKAGVSETQIQANEQELERITYQQYLGYDTASRLQSLNEYLNRQINPTSKAIDVKQVANQQFTELGKQDLGIVKQTALLRSREALSIFDPNYWMASDKEQYYAERQVQAVEEIQKGEAWKTWIGVQAPAYENVIIPLATGGAFKYISLSAKAVKAGSLAEKAYKVWNVEQKVIQYGVVPATIGTDIGMTAANTGGFTSKETLSKIGVIGWQAGLMGVGYKYTNPTAPKVEVIAKMNQGKVQEFAIQKYVEVLGKQIKYGQEVILRPKVSTGYEPSFETYKGLPIETGKVETPIKDMKGFRLNEKGVPGQGERGIPSKVPKLYSGLEPSYDTYTGVRYIDTYRAMLKEESLIKNTKGFKLSEKGVPGQGEKGIPSKITKLSTGLEPSYDTYTGVRYIDRKSVV